MKKPTNTTAESRDNPIAFLAEPMLFGGSVAIERQEAIGRAELVASEVLPTDLGHGAKVRQVLEGYGIKFLGVCEDDPIFQSVELPAGWSKKPTDHSMWSKLVDDKGRERAAIFYKAAFYDRSALLHLTRRFSVTVDYERREKDNVAVATASDGETVIHTTEPKPIDGEAYWRFTDEAKAEAVAWLTERYPDWQNPAAYWDEP